MKEAVRKLSERVIFATRDLGDVLRGRRNPMIPPRRLMYDGPQDPDLFVENGLEFFNHYQILCALRPDEDILDVGCGMGRKTLPLTAFLSHEARYVGLDVNPRGVAWCRARISCRFPNFEFHRIDVRNGRYNPSGAVADADYRFPFAESSFDFVVMASVFTHMQTKGVEQYLRETKRVLRRDGGRCLVSFFLLNPDSRAGIAASRSQYNFRHRVSDCQAVERSDRPEDAVAYEESWLISKLRETGFVRFEIHRGSWSGRPSSSSFQDLVVAYVGSAASA